jgi:hypothetical protein
VELNRVSRPDTTEFDALMVISIQQRLLNKVVENVLNVNHLERRVMIEEVAELMVQLDKVVASS